MAKNHFMVHNGKSLWNITIWHVSLWKRKKKKKRILTRFFCTSGQNLVNLTWTGDELLHGQTCDLHTHTDTYTHRRRKQQYSKTSYINCNPSSLNVHVSYKICNRVWATLTAVSKLLDMHSFTNFENRWHYINFVYMIYIYLNINTDINQDTFIRYSEDLISYDNIHSPGAYLQPASKSSSLQHHWSAP